MGKFNSSTIFVGASGFCLFALVGSVGAQSVDAEGSQPTFPTTRAAPSEYKDGLQAMLARARDGKVRVIFTLSPQMLSAREGAAQIDLFNLPADALANGQNRLLDSMKSLGISETKPVMGTPLVVGVVNAQQLRALSESGQVGRMEEDIAVAPTLAQSVPLINAPTYWGAGAGTRGQGTVVAVLDTGVMSNHSFLAGKVVSEACFSTTSTTTAALCTNGSTAVGSGAPCTTMSAGCWHGTHVAGIAVGKQNSSTAFNGVAPEAKILAIQVFSGVTTGGITGFSSDIFAALAHVRAKKNTGVNISSANLSLGGGAYTSHCSGTATSPTNLETLITQLRAVNVATVISSGNDSYANAVAWPACATSAITVGASSKTDTWASFSNASSQIDVLAPGVSINSSTATGVGNYTSANGTSMSAPHVAGAYALLRQRYRCYPQSVIDTALASTGVPIAHPSNGQTYRRINLQAANAQLWPLRFTYGCSLPPVERADEIIRKE